MTSTCDTGEVSVGQGPVLVIQGRYCRTGTSTCDTGEVSVDQGPVLVIQGRYL